MIELIEKLSRLHPNEEQLKKINAMRPFNQPEYVAEELIMVPLMASSNLIHLGYETWSINSLKLMTASYQEGGQDLMLDHDWWDTKNTVGMVFDADLIRMESAALSSPFKEYLIKKSKNPEWDLKIIDRQGYYQVFLYAFVEVSHPIHSEIRYARKSDVSIGGFAQTRLLCPLCSINEKPVEFRDKHCPHYIPNEYDMAYAEEDELEDFAPYLIRDGWDFSVEVSFVYQGNSPCAKVVNQRLIDLMLL